MLKSWLLAARLRTLPLSISGILMGAGMARRAGVFELDVFLLALGATLGFQVLSNFANDYGDGVKGTDNAARVGPARALQSGLLTTRDLIKGMVVTTVLTMVCVVVLIYAAFGSENLMLSLLFLFLGIGAIVAAVKYTVGKSAYGYKGLGDLFVFLFFGLVGVLGSYFLFAKQISWYHVFPAITVGLLSTAVLHLNNMRDRIQDQKVGKNTLAVFLGKERSVHYHFVILGIALISWCSYLLLTQADKLHYLTLVVFLVFIPHFLKVMRTTEPQLLDPELKKIALSTFLIALLYFVLSH